MGHLLKSICCFLFLFGLAFSQSLDQIRFIENKEKGTLTIYEGQEKILTYCFKDQLKREADPEQIRSCYIHPLYSLDGNILTDDFPKDHPHHPDFPPTWLIRNSYAGILNISWPGIKPAILLPGEPVTLGYRIYIHKGDVQKGRVKKAYQEYISKYKQD